MLRLFNTATDQIEPVTSNDNGLTLYVCGVTPYDTTHLGHAFVYVVFDSLVRFLRNEGLVVTYAQNVTDIDDDILRKSKELGLPFDTLAERETAQFKTDMASLNVLEPDAFVPATTVIPGIVDAVTSLVQSGAAYVVEGNVYFDNRGFSGYGRPLRGDRSDMLRLAAEHGGFPDDPKKRDPLDFLLWQAHSGDEPSWRSPWGPGRPGWHIECSTIAMSFLGFPVDIHGGGSDLIFPHHASELAQAETLTGRAPFVRHWMHNAMVRMDGEKMSKSLGNMVFIRDLVQTYTPDAIRLYLLSHHYREPFEWKEAELRKAAHLAVRLRAVSSQTETEPARERHIDKLRSYLEDDFRTDLLVAELSRMVERDTSSAAVAWAKTVLGLLPAAEEDEMRLRVVSA